MADEATDESVEVEEPAEVETAEADEAEPEETTEDEQGNAEPSESSTESEEPAEDDTAEQVQKQVQARIDELTRRYYQERQAREALEAQMSQQPSEPGKTLADFEYDESKFAEYLTQQARQSAEAEAKSAAQREQQIRRQVEFETREAAFSAKAPDYMAVTRDPSKTYFTDSVVSAAMETEKGPDVLYYLAKNPEVGRMLAQLPPLSAAIEIGRIEASKLVAPKMSESKPVATPPKIKAKGSPEKIDPRSPNSDKLSDDEWLKRRQKQLASRA